MWNYDIGLTGLDAARKGLDVIGNNISNAATDGYHRQILDLTPSFTRQEAGSIIGGGVNVEGVKRLIDNYVDYEIRNQQSTLGQVSQESQTLSTVESTFGELSSDTNSTGLNALMNKFFSSLNDLSNNPSSAIYQNEVVSAGQELTSQFRTLGNFLNDTQTQIYQQSETIASQINSISTQIADMNNQIQTLEMSGSQSGNLLDQRDQLINQLSQFVGVQTQQRDFGVVDVTINGIPLVMGSLATPIQSGLNNDGKLAITVKGANNFQTDTTGGQLGGLITLYNTTISGIKNNLDTLAQSLISQVNKCHCQGVGSAGSFTELTGGIMQNDSLSDCFPPITNGSFYIRVTDNAGNISRYKIDVDPQTDTLDSIATAINNATGNNLDASVSDNRLSIRANSGYKFDFLPAVLPTVENISTDPSSHLSATASGIYTGTENLKFTFTVAGSDSVGNGNLQLHVTAHDENGNAVDVPVDTLNIGSGYSSDENLDLGNGLKITVGAGALNAGDSFDVKAYANTDTSGFLSAAGLNVFFTGSSASNFDVAGDISDSPNKIATSLGDEATDNTNVLNMAALADTVSGDLNSLTPGDYYRNLVTDIGQQVSTKQTAKTNAEDLMQSLTNQQSDVSGVDMNEEAAQMLVYEQMFQGMAKYITTIQSTLTVLMDMVGT